MAASFASSAQNNVVVIPLGSDEAPTFKTIFLTETLVDGDIMGKCIGGLDGPSCADKICQEEADSTGSKVQGKKFIAWISGVLTNSFRDSGRIFNKHDLEYRLTDGALVASDYSSLVDGSLHGSSISKTVRGITPPGTVYVKTGIYFNGALSNTYTCNGWTSSSSANTSLIGHFGAKDGRWTNATPPSWEPYHNQCNIAGRFYCVEQ
jgi:hypothetical protein